MNIDLFSLMVKDRILDNDEVVLPGIGIFVAEVVPSSFSDKGYTVNPPYRRLSFRHRPEAAGEELARMYARDNDVSLDDASRILADFLTEMQDILRKKKAVELPGLGRLRATKENNFFFVPDEELDIWPDGFGLHPVSLKFHQETREEVSEAIGALADMMKTTVPAVEPDPEIEAVPEMINPTPEPIPAIELEPAIDPEPVPEKPEPEQEAEEPEIREVEEPEIQEPVQSEEVAVQPEPETAAVAETDAATEDVKIPAPDPVLLPDFDIEEELPKRTSRRKKHLRAATFSIAGIAACLILYVAIARLNPGIFDSILYTQEELRIIRQAAILP